jgi:phosphoribosylaminoimidazolecarboxamide formyltransferase/IMP cyclohydrolase
VCVNLYPFFEKVRKGLSPAETIEFIDIGGPALLRSAAKNFADVIALTESEDYPAAIEEIKSGSKNIPLRRHLAAKVFNLTAAYDAAVGRYLSDVGGAAPGPFAVFPRYWQVPFEKSAELRYGENSHQRAALYRFADAGGFVRDMERLNGKELSFNNIRDLDLAWKAASSFGYASEPPGGTVFTPALGSAELRSLSIDCPPPAACCVAVKHNTPCGIGQADAGGRAAYEAFVKAKACDPVSIFGGITAFNCAVDAKTAAALNELFLEIVAAPAFTDDALDLLRQKKNLRVIRIPYPPRDVFESVSVDGGILVQDAGDRLFQKWEVVTREAPPPELLPSLIFGMRSVCWSKSNAIAVVKEGALVGEGSGET